MFALFVLAQLIGAALATTAGRLLFDNRTRRLAAMMTQIGNGLMVALVLVVAAAVLFQKRLASASSNARRSRVGWLQSIAYHIEKIVPTSCDGAKILPFATEGETAIVRQGCGLTVRPTVREKVNRGGRPRHAVFVSAQKRSDLALHYDVKRVDANKL